MLILKQKLNAPTFTDKFGNEYQNIVAVASDINLNFKNKSMTVTVRYFKDVNSIFDKDALMSETFYWDKYGIIPKDVNGNDIDWSVFMATVPREEWKDTIADIGRIPFNDLSVGLNVTVTGFDFVNNPIGQAWKEIMLFLPVHNDIRNALGIKFMDEIFEYDTI